MTISTPTAEPVLCDPHGEQFVSDGLGVTSCPSGCEANWLDHLPAEGAVVIVNGAVVIVPEEDGDEHDPTCTACDHDCPWARVGRGGRLLHLGAPHCATCEDHAEAVHEGYGETPCECADHNDAETAAAEPAATRAAS